MKGVGITSLVRSYVKLRNVDALLALRTHRMNLLSQQSQVLNYDSSLLKRSFEDDLTVITQGIDELLSVEPIRGALDSCVSERISGWAQYTRYPEIPVTIRVFVDNDQTAEVVADRFRSDLKNGGIGSGNHGFEFRPDPPLGDGVVQVMSSTGIVFETKNTR